MNEETNSVVVSSNIAAGRSYSTSRSYNVMDVLNGIMRNVNDSYRETRCVKAKDMSNIFHHSCICILALKTT